MNTILFVKAAGARLHTLSGIALAGLLVVGLGACAEDESAYGEDDEGAAEQAAEVNTLTEAEEAEGWQLLFTGEDFTGWRGLGREDVPRSHWTIEDGAIKKIPSGEVPLQADGQPVEGGDLMTERAYENFEFAFDWKISPEGNSGVKYNVSEEMSTSQGSGHNALGYEYQVIDNAYPGIEDAPKHHAGALYDLVPPRRDVTRPPGEWNHSRIVLRGNHGEHWLNGEKVVEYDLESPRFDSLFALSKYRDIPGFKEKKRGHLILQDHTDAAWYRNLKVRELPAE